MTTSSPQHTQSLLVAHLTNAMQRAAQVQRNHVETLAEQAVKNGSVTGFIAIGGEGESVVDVSFPLMFLEKPVFTHGLELGDNTWLSHGSFPMACAVVGAWKTKRIATSTVYIGATLGVVVLGINGSSILHYSFQAQSFTSATTSVTSVDYIL